MTTTSTHVFRDAEIDWDDPLKSTSPAARPPETLVAEAKRTGARRKLLVRGECGFFMNRAVLPAHFGAVVSVLAVGGWPRLSQPIPA